MTGASGGHVWIVPSGFGLRVIPAGGPYECSLEDDGDLRVRVGEERLSVSPHHVPADPLASCSSVADVVAGPSFPEWWLDARLYRVPLPKGWTMIGPSEVPECWFVRAGQLAVFLQTAKHAPADADWAAPGQQIVDAAVCERGRWVELAYRHDGRPWRQRHVVLTGGAPSNVVITAQGPVEDVDRATELQRWLVERIVITP